jgi:Common central domain of tyrosinase
MGVRKNAKFLSATERENLVRAFVLMKADIVNPLAPPADRYSRWDELVAVHRLIQSVDGPLAVGINYGHGGLGAYGFLSWHRYFLFLLEQRLQGYVPGVTLPYWDWTDPTTAVLVTDFLGPDGDPASNDEVRQGYFALEAPGTGSNATPAPPWWPVGLTGWTLHAAFGTWAGALRRNLRPVGELPASATLRSALDKGTYSAFQNAVESGSGTVPFHQLHNGLHGWFGAGSHMSSVVVSPFDPIFYLHHCQVDRLWALWQMDGHATEYPLAGGDAGHHRNDPMYPWVGGAPGYSSNYDFPPITMPDFSGLGIITPEDVLDHRALGYSYDSQVVIGIALDRTGSMLGVTPDPMTTPAPDVTKWEAAKRGVSAFLLDCETVFTSTEAYVVGGVKTFRRVLANDFAAVFPGTPYGLIKPGGAYGSAAFDAAAAALTPGGSTPLADALADAHDTLVVPPFGTLPADERRYLALLTDGLLTSGSPLASIPDGSFAMTAVFAMGFGTGADVDYPTLDAIVAKGQPLTSQQVFHGENPGTIDKFYSQALAAALGFTPVTDPVIELFAGEHAHLEFPATSAEDTLFLTAQGMDFDDEAWAFQLVAPDGGVVYHSGGLPLHAHGGGHPHVGPRRPSATARRGRGRLSLVIQRDSADPSAWVGGWTLMIAWRARQLDAMVMLDPGELMRPVGAGPVRGPRYARLLVKPEKRRAARAVSGRPRHRFDIRATSTNSSRNASCSMLVNVYARTRLRVEARPEVQRAVAGTPLDVTVAADALRGAVRSGAAFARLVAPARDLAALVRSPNLPRDVLRGARLDAGDDPNIDVAKVLARLEARTPALAEVRDEELKVVVHGGPAHVHVEKTGVPGVYHVGLWVEGVYLPDAEMKSNHEEHHSPSVRASGEGERFTRVLSASIGLSAAPRAGKKAKARVKRSGARKTVKRSTRPARR